MSTNMNQPVVPREPTTTATPAGHRGSVAPVAGVGLLAVAVAAGAFSLGAIPRRRREAELVAATAAARAAKPVVNVVRPRRDASHAELLLPGSALPWLQADLYARTNGYLKQRLVDIGDRVKQGQLLAVIEAPDIDAQLEQAQATVVQSRATLVRAEADEVYAGQQEERFTKLYQQNAATQQDYENYITLHKSATANVSAMKATIQVNEADVLRLTTLQAFQKLTAPFDGVVTARNVDPGDLVTADNPGSERLLFRIQDTDPVRVFVDVPQIDSTFIKRGQPATVFRREDPSRLFTGTVSRTADSLDSVTRTLRTEIDIPNPDGALMPGMYLQVKLAMAGKTAPILIPTAAMVIRSNGPTVAVLDQTGAVRYRAINVGRDYGAEIEVISGLTGDEQVVMHPGDDLPEGMAVEVNGAAGR